MNYQNQMLDSTNWNSKYVYTITSYCIVILIDICWGAREPSNRKIFLEQYAKRNGFDSQNQLNWTKQVKTDLISSEVCFLQLFKWMTKYNIINIQEGFIILSYYNFLLSRAIYELFPGVRPNSPKAFSESWDLGISSLYSQTLILCYFS